MDKTITIVTVSFNDATNLKKTIENVTLQDYKNLEYIVIDGGSKDNSVEIIKNYKYKIDFWISEPDRGIYDAMNKSLNYAHGSWILFMNAGDTFVSNNTLSQVFAHDIKDDVCVIYGDNYLVYPFGKSVNRASSNLDFSRHLPFNHQSSMVRTSVIKKYLFNTDYKILADMDMFYRIFKDGLGFMHVDVFICNYLMDGFSSTNGMLFFKEREKLLGTYGSLGYYIRHVKQYVVYHFKSLVPNSIVTVYRSRKYKR